MAVITGTSGNDTINTTAVSSGVTGGPATAGNDTIDGGAGNDIISSGGGDDIITGGAGDDIINGQTDATTTGDTAVYSGSWRDYTISFDSVSGTYTVKDNVAGRDGTDTLTNIEKLQFSNGTFAIADTLNNVPTVSGAVTNTTKTEDSAAFTVQLITGVASDLDLTQIGSGAGGEALTINSHSYTAGGNWTGSITYSISGGGTLSLNPSQFNSLQAGQTAVLNVNYTIRDANGATVANTATITIQGANDAPTVNAIVTPQNANEDAAYSFTVPANTFSDVDAGTTLTYSAALASGAALPAWLTFNAATRQFSGMPANGDVGSIVVRITASDGTASATSDFTIIVANTEDEATGTPTITGGATATEDTVLNVDVTGLADVDGTGITGYAYQWERSDNGTNGWTQIGAATTANYAPGDADVGKFLRVVVTTTDSTGGTTVIPSAATAAVINVNDQATITGTAMGSVAEDNPATATGTLTVSDVDAGQGQLVAVAAGTPGASNYGTFEVSAAGAWTYTLGSTDGARNTAVQRLGVGDTLTDSITVQSLDGTATQVITVTITGTNDAPTVGFVQSFETDSTGVVTGGGYGALTIVADGTGGISTPDGNNFALLTEADGSGPFTRFDGYRATFADGLTASVNVYLDPAWGAGSGFDYSVAASGSDGAHQRDYIFHVAQDISTGQLLIGASNNTNFEVRQDLESQPGHAVVTAPGWYTLQHTFQDNAGVLAVHMNVLDATGAVVFSQVLSSPGDTIPAEVGGNRYGWFTAITVPGGLAVDMLTLGTLSRTVTEIVDNGPGETTTIHSVNGAVPFADIDTSDAHSVTITPMGTGYLGSINAVIDDASTGDRVGMVRWTYTVADGAIEHLDQGQTLTQTYTLTIDDGEGGTSSQTVTVTLVGKADAANVPPVTVYLTETDAVLTTSGTLTIADVDTAATFIPQSNAAGSNGYGMFQLDADGAWSYATTTPNNQFVPGQHYSDILTVTAADGTTSSITVDIVGTNDAPTVTGPSSGAISETIGIAGIRSAGPAGGLEPDASLLNSTINSALVSIGTVVGAANFAAQYNTILTQLGGNVAQTIGVIWDHLDDNYSAYISTVNEPFVRLGLMYQEYLNGGGKPFYDTIAKYIADGGDLDTAPDRYQTIHDNLLGNLSSASLNDRFGPSGANNAALLAELTGLVTTANPDLLTRPYYDGNETSSPAAARAWDAAEGYLPAATGTLTLADVDGGTPTASVNNATAGVVYTPSGGSATTPPAALNLAAITAAFSVTSAGVWSYDARALDFNPLAAGDTLALTYSVVVSDGQGGTTTQPVSIVITGTNDGPVAVADTLTATEDTPVTFSAASLLGNDSDVDVGAMLTIGSVTSGTGGMAVLNSDGSVTFTPTANFNGPATFTYTASDSSARSLSATVTVNVAATPDVDTFTPNTTLDASVLTGGNLLIGGGIPGTNFAVATDAADAPGVQIGLQATLRTSGGTFIDFASDPTGHTYVVPAGVALGTPQDNTGTSSDNGYARWNVNMSIGTDTDGNNVGNLSTYNYTFSISQIADPNDTPFSTVTYTMAQLIAANLVSATGEVYQQSYNFAFATAGIPGFSPNEPGTYRISITATDPATGTDVLSNYINVVVNTPPEVDNDALSADRNNATLLEDPGTTGYVFSAAQLLANDSDAQNDTLTIASVGGAVNGTVTLNVDGTVTFVPDANHSGTASFTYTASDGRPGAITAPSVAATVTLTINPVTDMPTLSVAPGTASGAEDSTGILLPTISAVVNDLTGTEETITAITVSHIPDGATLTDGTNTFTASAILSYVDVHGWTLSAIKLVPVTNFDGTINLSVTATAQDGAAAPVTTAAQTIAVTVTPVSDAPSITVTPTASGNEDQPIALTINAPTLADADETITAITVAGIPVGATLTDGTVGHTFTASAGTTSVNVHGWTLSAITITPPADSNADFTLTVTATSQDDAATPAVSSPVSLAVTVLAVADTDNVVRDTSVVNDSTDGEAGTELTVGSGIPVNHMSVATDAADAPGLEIALRADMRFTGPAPFGANTGTYVVPAGTAGGTPNDDLDGPSPANNPALGGYDNLWARWNYTVSINADTDDHGGRLGDYVYTFTISHTAPGGGSPTVLASVTLEQALTAAGYTPTAIATFNAQDLYQDSINLEPSLGELFDPSQPGTYHISVTATDRQNGSAVLADSINVLVNTAPDAVNDAATAGENAAISGSVFTNDTDAQGYTAFTVTAVNGSAANVGSGIALTATINGAPVTLGHLVINAYGTYTFTPTAAANGLGSLDEFTQTVSYTIQDSAPVNGLSDPRLTGTASLTITLSGTNDVPEISVTTGQTPTPIVEDASPFTTSGALHITDADFGESFFRPAGAPSANPALAGTYGTLTINAAGNWTYTLNNTAVQGLGEGDTLIDTISVVAFDGTTYDLPITIRGVNDAVTITAEVAGALLDTAAADTASSLGTLTGDLAGNITDADVGVGSVAADTHTFSIVGQTITSGATSLVGSYGTLMLNTDGSYSYVPNAAAINARPAGAVTDVFNVQVSDGTATAASTLTVNITGANDTPVITAEVGTPTLVDSSDNNAYADVTGTLDATDGDSGATLTYGLAAGEDGNDPLGALTVNANGTYTFVPNATAINALQSGSHTAVFNVQVSDGIAAPVTTTLTINVTAGNDAPEITAEVGTTTLVDTSAANTFANVTGSLADNASDRDTGASLTYALASGENGNDPLGTLTVATDGSYTFVPNTTAINALQTGAHTAVFNVQVSDGIADPVTTTLTVNITGANDAPIAVNVGGFPPISEGATFAGTFGVSFPISMFATDVDNTLTPSSVGFTGVTIGGVAALSLAEAGIAYNSTTGAFTVDANVAAYNGLQAGETTTVVVSFTATDGSLTSNTGTATFTVTGTNDLPLVSATSDSESESESGVSAAGTISFSDVDLLDTPTVSAEFTSHTYSGTPALTSAQLAALTPQLTVTANAGNANSGGASWAYSVGDAAVDFLAVGETVVLTYTVTANDGHGGVVTTPLTVTITGTNDAPTIDAVTGVTLTDTVANDTFANVTGTLVGHDVDHDAVLTYALSGSGSTAYGTMTVQTNGQYTFVPNAAAINALNVGADVVLTFPVLVTDDQNASSATTPITITIVRANDTATLTGNITGTVYEDSVPAVFQTATGTITATDVDDVSGMTAATVAGTYGSLTINAAGAWTYTLTNAAANVQALAEDQTVIDAVTVATAGGSPVVISVTVKGTNDGPVITGVVSSSVNEGTGDATVNLLAGTTDVDNGYTLTIVAGSGNLGALPAGVSVSGSTLTVNTNHASFNSLGDGATTTLLVTYQVTDGIAPPVNQTATIVVAGTNDAPTVVGAVTASGTEDTGVMVVNLLSGASDVDAGDVLSVSAIAGLPVGITQVGSLLVIDTSAFPNGLTATALSYNVLDNKGGSVAQTAQITVTNVNDAPVAIAAVGAATEDGAVASGTVMATDVDSTQLTFALVGTAPEGLVFNSDGTWTFSAASYDALGQGQTLAIVLPFTATDNQGATSQPGTLTITVTGTNDVPVVVAQTSVATEGGAVVSIDALVGATDVDGGALSVVDLPASLPAGVTYSAATHTFSFNPADPAYNGMAAGASQNIVVTYGVSDGLETTLTTAMFTLVGTNDAPVATSGVVFPLAINEGSAFGGTIVAGAPANATEIPMSIFVTDVDDAPQPSELAFTGATIGGVPVASLAAAGISYVPATGVFSIVTAGIPQYEALALNATTSVVISYTSTDAHGATSNTGTVQFTVKGTNDVPTVTAGASSVVEDGVVAGMVAGTDTDSGETATLVYAVVGAAPTGLTFNPNGSYTFDASSYDGLPAGATQVIVVPFTATDAQGATSAPADLTITITGTNDGATIAGAVAGTIAEDADPSTTTGTLTISDADTGEAAVVAVVAGTAGDNGYGSFHVTAAGVWTYTLNNGSPAVQALGVGQSLTDRITVTSADGSDTQVVTVTIQGTNDVPTVAAALADAAATEDVAFTFTVPLATFADLDGDTLTLQATGVPAWLTFNPATGTFTGTPPNAAANSTHNITVSASDGNGGQVSDTFTIAVTVVNDAPVANVIAAGTFAPVLEGNSFSGTLGTTIPIALFASDQDSTLTASSFTFTGVTIGGIPAASLAAAGISYAAATGAFMFDGTVAAYAGLAANETTDVVVSFTATDGSLASNTGSVTFTVAGTNDVPVVAAASASVAEDATITGFVSVTDADLSDTHTFALTNPLSAPVGLVFNSNGTYSFNASSYDGLPAGATQVIVVPFTATDAQGAASAAANLTITITGTNDGATISGTVAGTVREDAPASNLPSQIATGTLVISDADAGEAAVVAVVAGTAGDNGYGSFHVTAAGVWTYTLDNGKPAVQALGAGETLTDRITVTSADGTASQVITVVIEGTNGAPLVTGSPMAAAENSGLYIQDLLAGVFAGDEESQPVHVANVVVLDPDENPVLPSILTVAGNILTLNTDAAMDIAQGEVVVLSVSYDVIDSQGGVTPVSRTLTITGANDAPVVSGPVVALQATEGLGEPVSVWGLANVADPDTTPEFPGTAQNLAIILPATLPPGVSFDPETNLFSLDPLNAAFNVLQQGELHTITVNYHVSDNIADPVPHQVSFTIVGTNDAPVVTGAVAGAAVEDTGLQSMNLLANAADPEGNALTVIPGSVVLIGMTIGSETLPLPPEGMSIEVLGLQLVGNQIVINTSDPSIDLRALELATLTFSYSVSDGASGVTPATATLTLTGVNDVPVATDDGGFGTTNVAPPLLIPVSQLLANDVDEDFNTTLSIHSISSGPGGSVSFDEFGNVVFTQAPGFVGMASFTYTVTDGVSVSAPATVKVAVTHSASTITFVADDAMGGNALAAEHTVQRVGHLAIDVLPPGVTVAYALAAGAPAGFEIRNGNELWVATEVALDYEGLNNAAMLAVVATISNGAAANVVNVNVVATDVEPESIDGTAAGETIVIGDAGTRNFAYGLGGDDILLGGSHNDVLSGGAGKDSYNGGAGDDWISFDATDVATSSAGLIGGSGFDYAYMEGTGNVSLTLTDANGIESVFVQDGNDTVDGSALTTAFYAHGGGGNDTLRQGSGGGQLFGGDGNDKLYDGTGDDLMFGEAGNDILDGSKGGYNLMYGGAGADQFIGGGDRDVMFGGTGADSFDGGAGNDTIYADAEDVAGGVANIKGGSGFDDLIFDDNAPHNIVLTNANGIEGVIGGGGDDQLDAHSVSNYVYLVGGGGNDTLSASVTGGPLRGDAGFDVLVGGAGVNHMEGGTGSDLFVLGTGVNYVYDFDAADGDLIDASASGSAFADLTVDSSAGDGWTRVFHGTERIALVHSNALDASNFTFGGVGDLTGTSGSDYLIGNSAADTLDAGAGIDVLLGRGGADRFAFEDGDSVAGAADRIGDWQNGVDIIDLIGVSSVSTFADLSFGLAADGSVVIADAGPGDFEVRIAGASISDFDASDFYFHGAGVN